MGDHFLIDAKNGKNSFKKPYSQYTNYGMGMIDIFPDKNEKLKKVINNNTVLNFTIKRQADLISHMYFKFTLPDIYSLDENLKNEGLDISFADDNEVMFNFEWIERIGEYIINEATFYIENTPINKLYAEWMHIWSELNMPLEKN